MVLSRERRAGRKVSQGAQLLTSSEPPQRYAELNAKPVALAATRMALLLRWASEAGDDP